eukprot:TRINITY_DN3933_c0_g1_i1.p1 TRINITY_DN3933_c0_g1~~TRINITY_DN3933_c0_g1_i1.p1  ORF type:complete len:474 (-),score=137.14 TRINITY_DN3933_c0_g1_i1:101-1522(-)
MSEKEGIQTTMPKPFINPKHFDSIQENYNHNDKIINNIMKEEEKEDWENTINNLRLLSSYSSILSSSIMYHYVLGSPKPENQVMFNLSNVIINTITNYLPKSIKTTYTTIPNLEESFVCAETKRYILQILLGLNHFFEHVSKASTLIKKKNKDEVLNEQNLSDSLILLQRQENKRKMQSIFDQNNDQSLKIKKINKLKVLLLEKTEKTCKNQPEKIKIMIRSIVTSMAPVIITSIESYFNPNLLAKILKRSIDVVFEIVKEKKEKKNMMESKNTNNNKKDTKKDDKEEEKKESETEKLIALQYGDLIDSISKNLISCLKIGFFSQKLLSGALYVVPNKVIGKAICKAINPNPNSDLSKIKFVYTLLFNEKDSQKIAGIDKEAFTFEDTFKIISKLEPHFKPVELQMQQKNMETKDFYDQLSQKIILLIQTALPKTPIPKETIAALIDFLKVILTSPKLLDIMIYDYLMVYLLA